MRVAIDAVGIRGHGGAAVLCELLHWLPTVRPEWKWHIFLFDRHLREFDDPGVESRVTLEAIKMGNWHIGRLLWVNRHLPARINAIGVDVLLSFANIAPLRACTPQVVFCHQSNAFFCEGIPLSALRKRARLRFMRNIILRGGLASDAMLVQTDAMRQRILSIEPSLNDRIHVVPSGYRTPHGKRCIRAEKKILIDTAERPRLIYVSHPSEHKNHINLVRAIPRIINTFPSASLLLTLEKNKTQNRRYNYFIDEIELEATRYGVSKHVVWLGILNPGEVDYALRNSDLTVFPSQAESFGLGLAESMAAGCPIAASDRLYAHDVCGEAAVYFNPSCPESIAHAVLETLNNGSLLQKLVNKATERKSQFSYEFIAERIAAILWKSAHVGFSKCTTM